MNKGQANMLEEYPHLPDSTFFMWGTVVRLTLPVHSTARDTILTGNKQERAWEAAGQKQLCGTRWMVSGFDRKNHYSTAGRANFPRAGRQMDVALFLTVHTKPQKAYQNRDISAGPKNGGQVDSNWNNGNHTSPITKIAKQLCRDPISVRMKSVKCWLVFRSAH